MARHMDEVQITLKSYEAITITTLLQNRESDLRSLAKDFPEDKEYYQYKLNEVVVILEKLKLAAGIHVSKGR